MRIRLHGTPTETAAILTALAHVLTIQHISRPYPDRPRPPGTASTSTPYPATVRRLASETP